MEKDIVWFKENIVPLLHKYKLKYSSFENGDFGSLERVEFDGNNKGGNIDFWSSGWLNIHLVDYYQEKEIINVLIEPDNTVKKDTEIKILIDELLL